MFPCQNEAEKLYEKLARLKSINFSQQSKHEGFFGLFGRRVNLVEVYEKKLENLEDNMRMQRSLLAGEVNLISVNYKHSTLKNYIL